MKDWQVFLIGLAVATGITYAVTTPITAGQFFVWYVVIGGLVFGINRFKKKKKDHSSSNLSP